MILAQHANEDEDMDVVAEEEEEELQALTSVKWTRHQEKIMLKLSHHVTRQRNPNLRHKLSHHVTRQSNPWYHPRLKPKLYQPINPAQAVPPPLDIPIGMDNVPLAVGQSGHPPNVQLLYGLLVPQNDKDPLLSGRQPTIVMYNLMIQKCFTCDL